MNRIKDKIKEIAEYLEELEEVVPGDFEEYLENKEKRAACERYFEKIIESLVDLGNLFIKFKRYPLPSEDVKIFEILLEKNVISKELCENMKDAKGMELFTLTENGNSVIIGSIEDIFFYEEFVDIKLNTPGSTYSNTLIIPNEKATMYVYENSAYLLEDFFMKITS